ncbi:L-seryl-tRNA(Sec) selenium transferase [Alicyclobacillus ferrooxydans]|uniref:L-seryl-tRNA(Sec) selenium transferase n=1 Tax=Alicyclobacillus ferrooxydans TaxID=471514 RepID=A0A0P9CWT0_9BACL|nr:L-seryl-tRNA(Sec) selenium transferase [Alicyclobacillus ferrooxydans]KPV44220.1 hypothetical protein AN477_07910 [Alicyclobacillus ferrooxydans]
MNNQNRLRSLPAIGKLLHHDLIKTRFSETSHQLLVSALTDTLSHIRRQAQSCDIDDDAWVEMASVERIADMTEHWLQRRLSPQLRPVINLTGTIIHTNLGRAPLSRRALEAVVNVAQGYSNLEFDIPSGERGSRHSHVESLLCELTGAEAGIAVNNNAAAVLLVLSTLGAGGDGIVSRGQLVEIGGSFRIPDIMALSGVRLVEVGTTNKTRIDDYVQAISDQTRLILRVHTSNYRIIGFTEQPEREALAAAAQDHGVVFYEDLGSGALFDYTERGIGDEPTVPECIHSGVDVVSFSGDKLLGGPQAGMIVGRKKWIDAMKKHPLARALRLDKMTLAALENTLLDHLDEKLTEREVPVVRMITAPYAEVAARAEQLAQVIRLHSQLGVLMDVEVGDSESTIGGGAFPGETLPTRILTVQVSGISAEDLAAELRTLPERAIISRVHRGHVTWDVRTLLPGQEDLLVEALLQWAQRR